MTRFLSRQWAAVGATALAVASTCGAAVSAAEADVVPAEGGVVAGLAPGWPVVLRGSVIGTPLAADLDGDGKLEIVASAMGRRDVAGLVSPEPTIAAQLWAFHADGQSAAGWPLTVKTVEQHQAMYDDKGFAPWADNWYASPSAWDINDDGASEIILNTAGHGTTEAQGNILALYADGGRVSMAHGGSDWATVPLADIDGDEIPDIVLDKIVTNVQGGPVRGWPLDRRPTSGYQPTIGDADGDGQVEVFMPSSKQEVWGLNAKGEALPGWPRKVSGYSTYIVMGDVAGDSKKEIITVDMGNNLRVWNFDGTPVTPPTPRRAPEDDGAVATGMDGYSPPCLADLDGDGKAEILTLGNNSRAVFAWRGDGRSFLPNGGLKGAPLPTVFVRGADSKDRQLDPKNPADRAILEDYATRQSRGLLTNLPQGNASWHGGVTAVDLGGDGVMDIFAGTQWIRLAKDGSVQMTDMVPAPQTAEMTMEEAAKEKAKRNRERLEAGLPGEIRIRDVRLRPPSNDGSCSVVDIDGDGLAEVLFGLTDGRLFVYRTGMRLSARDAQWPTLSGSFQHTGVWTAAK